MKRKLLFMMLCIVGALGTTSLAQSFTDGGKYYFENVGAGKYWSAANSWGTQASFVNHPEFLTLHLMSDGTYQIESQVSNGGTKYYFNGSFMDNDSPVNLTITQSNDYYTIANGTNYYGYDGSSSVLGAEVDPTSNNRLWKIKSHDEMVASMSDASVDNPIDATFYIVNPRFCRNTRYGTAWTATKSGGNQTIGGGDQTQNGSCESWNNTFRVSQEISDIPNGVYKVECAGFGTNGTTYIFANDDSQAFVNTTSTSNFGAGRQLIANGGLTGNFVFTQVTDGKLNIGVKRESQEGADWAVFGNFSLLYYGNVSLNEVLLADFITSYKEALASAQEYQNVEMFDEDKEALNTVIENNTLNLTDASSLDQDQLSQATSNLNTAAAAAKKAAAVYAYYDGVKTAVNGNTNVDITNVLPDQNFGFEQGSLNLWTSDNGGYIATNDNFSGKVGSYYVERWLNGTPLDNGNLTHDELVLPAGLYTITVKAQNIEQYNNSAAGTGYFIYANDDKVEIGAAGTYSVTTYLPTDKSTLVIKMALENCTGNWISCDNFVITYIADDYPELTAVEGKMNSEVESAQTAAKSAYDANKNPETYTALVEAINAAQASVAAYSHLTPAITDADAFSNSADVTDTDYDEFSDAYSDIKTAYEAGTIADADIMTNVANVYNALAVLAKKQNVEGAAGVVDMTYAIINHSFEYGDMTGWNATASSDTGVRETANATYAATGSDRFYLFNTWWLGVPITQTVSDLPNGEYTLTASVSSDGATIYLIANGDHNEGTETGGEYPSKNVMQEATITFLVKDGTASIGAVGGDNGTAGEHKEYVEAGYWWYKADNFRLTFNRELTPEEIAVAPTDISVSDITLFKDNTETISVSYEPEDASEGYVSFTSSDENIATVDANGLITGVAYGEAEITVTSTLDPTVSATCNVTVTAPLYSEAVNLDFSEGPVTSTGITIRTYDKDKTGSDVAQMQPVNGWSFGVANGDAKASGVVAYGSEVGMGAAQSFYAPQNGPDDKANDNVLGMVGVWTGSVQYVQNVKFPAGAYTVTVPVYKVGGNEALTKNLIGVVLDDGTEYFAPTTSYTANEWKTEEISFVVAEDTYGKLSIGLNAPNVSGANSQRLYIDRIDIESVPLATAAEIATLNAVIEEAENNTLGFEAGEYAPYNNVEAIKALADAKVLDTTNPIVESVVLNATTTLQDAVWTPNTEEVNAVYDGTFAAAENNGAPLGWRMSNNTLGGSYHARAFVGDERLAEFNETNSAFYIRFDGTNSSRGSMYFYGDNEDGYSMPLKGNTTYYVKVDFAAWGATPGKPLRLNVTGPTDFTAITQEYNTSVRADNADNEPQQFYITFTTGETDGNYVINFQTPGADTNTHAVVVSNIELYRATSATMTIVAAAQYGTFIAPFDVTIPEGVTAYTVDDVAANGILTMSEVSTTIPANTPVVVYSELSDGVNETFYGKDNSSEDTTEGLLTGVYEETVVDPGNYVLQLLNGKTAFYRVSEETDEVKVGANRAYLTKTADATGNGIKAFFFGSDDDTPTGINAIEALQRGSAEIYNAAGVKVPALQKGVNIIRTADGKTQKVFVK